MNINAPLAITVLGSSSGFPTPTRSSPSVHLHCDEISILLDCGEGASWHLTHHQLGVSGLDAVLISHMHADHIGGLLQLVQTWQIGKWEGYTPQGYSPCLLVPAEGVAVLQSMLNAAYLMPEVLDPLKVVFLPVQQGLVFDNDSLEVLAFANGHLKRLSQVAANFGYSNNKGQSFSYALTFRQSGRRVVYSGDLATITELDTLLEVYADLLIVEMAHFTADELVSFIKSKSRNIGAILVNHIGPRYDEPKELFEALSISQLPPVFIGHDGLSLTI